MKHSITTGHYHRANFAATKVSIRILKVPGVFLSKATFSQDHGTIWATLGYCGMGSGAHEWYLGKTSQEPKTE